MAEDQGRYQMLWDCPACGTEGLLGLDHRFCPNCGAAQDPKLRYFPSDAQKILVEDHPYHGADKACPACDTPNAASAEFCQACGSPLDDAKAAARRSDKVLAEGDEFGGESVRDAKDEARERRQAEEERRRRQAAGLAAEEPPKKKRSVVGWLFMGCGVLAVLALVGCVGFWLLQWMLASSGEVTVAAHRWDRTIEVEQYQEVVKTDWEDKVPRGAQVLSCRDEVKDTKRVQDGEDCKTRKKDLGDGTFKEVRECEPTYRSEKVYGKKCRYNVLSWETKRKEQAAGEDLSPRWPTVNLSKPGTCIGCEREGKRHETYTVVLREKDGTEHTCDFAESRWKGLADGTSLEVSFGGLTGAVDCGSVK